MSNCKKCGSNDILTKYIHGGELIDSSSYKMVDDEFVSSSKYDMFYKLTAKKEHLKKNCRNCQFSWRERTIDDYKLANLP